jgi:hypothetical protein
LFLNSKGDTKEKPILENVYKPGQELQTIWINWMSQKTSSQRTSHLTDLNAVVLNTLYASESPGDLIKIQIWVKAQRWDIGTLPPNQLPS